MNIEKLQEIRKRKKITYKKLAELSNIPERTIYDVMLGITKNPRIDTMQAIENALGINDGSPLDNARVDLLTDKEKRLLAAFNSLSEALKDFALETIENLAEQAQNTELKRA